MRKDRYFGKTVRREFKTMKATKMLLNRISQIHEVETEIKKGENITCGKNLIEYQLLSSCKGLALFIYNSGEGWQSCTVRVKTDANFKATQLLEEVKKKIAELNFEFARPSREMKVARRTFRNLALSAG